FQIHEEWCYIDDETHKLRTIDIVAEKMLSDPGSIKRIRPSVVLHIECKRSELPYIFFEAIAPEAPRDFPFLAGLRNYDLVTKLDEGGSLTRPISSFLGMHRESFVAECPEACTIFSKLNRKGKKLEDPAIAEDFEMSGSQAYVSLMLPLIKSIHHYRVAMEPPTTANYFDLAIVLAIAVLDAPMLTLSVKDKKAELRELPWVRISRRGYVEAKWHGDRQRMYAVDAVHKDFFAEYIHEHVLPFASRVSESAVNKHEFVADGTASATS